MYTCARTHKVLSRRGFHNDLPVCQKNDEYYHVALVNEPQVTIINGWFQHVLHLEVPRKLVITYVPGGQRVVRPPNNLGLL